MICDPLIPAISLLTCLTPSPIPLAVAHSRSSLLELFGLPHSHQNLAHSLTFQWLLTLARCALLLILKLLTSLCFLSLLKCQLLLVATLQLPMYKFLPSCPHEPSKSFLNLLYFL